MLAGILPYIFLGATILLTVFSQLIIKWRISGHFADITLPEGLWDKFCLLITVLFDPFIFMGLCATFVSGLCWMATMTKLDISFAYPFTSLGFVLVLLFSVLLLGEPFNWYKLAGVALIVAGIVIASKGS